MHSSDDTITIQSCARTVAAASQRRHGTEGWLHLSLSVYGSMAVRVDHDDDAAAGQSALLGTIPPPFSRVAFCPEMKDLFVVHFVSLVVFPFPGRAVRMCTIYDTCVRTYWIHTYSTERYDRAATQH